MSQPTHYTAGHPGTITPAPAVLLVLAGPAGSGKSTLCDNLVAAYPQFSRIVTNTTRPPRPGEVNGVHYNFLSEAQFDAKVAAGEFLEWAWVHKIYRYGTLVSSVLNPLAEGRSLAINIDVQGVENFRRAAREHPLLARHMATVFIEVEMEELRRRMHLRAQDSESEIERRMKTAELEVREAEKFDFRIKSTTREGDFQGLLEAWCSTCRRITASTASR